MAFGFPMRDYLKGSKLYDLLFKGFRYQSELSFLKKVKKVLIEAFKSDDDDYDGGRAGSFINTIKYIRTLYTCIIIIMNKHNSIRYIFCFNHIT